MDPQEADPIRVQRVDFQEATRPSRWAPKEEEPRDAFGVRVLELAKKNAKEAPAGHDVFYWQDQPIKQRYPTHIRGFWRCPWFITGLGDYTGGNLSYYDTSGGVYHELQGYQGNGV